MGHVTTSLAVYFRALLYVLRRFHQAFSAGLSIERTRVMFIEDLRRGYTPEQVFRLSVQHSGPAPGTPEYDDMRALAEGFARDAGVGWQDTLKGGRNREQG